MRRAGEFGEKAAVILGGLSEIYGCSDAEEGEEGWQE